MGKPLSEKGMNKFLEGKMNVQMATIDEAGDPADVVLLQQAEQQDLCRDKQ